MSEGHYPQESHESEQESLDLPEQGDHENEDEEDDDYDAPMVHLKARDYASHAKEQLIELRSQGKEAILQSDLCTLIPREENEPADAYAKRYCDGMNEMIRRGVAILNDITTHDMAAGGIYYFGREFDVGPDSGVTRREYGEFGEWIDSHGDAEEEIPERFKKFEVPKGTFAARG